MDDERTDLQLTEAIRIGDQQAFKALFHKYYSKLFRYAVIHCGSRDFSTDLIEEVFFRLWTNREKLNPQKSIQAYLYKILNNLIINHKKLASASNVSIEHVSQQKTFEISNQLETQIDLRTALEKLPNKLKFIFVLIKVEGMKYNEAAKICNISVKAVEKRMTKALNLLRNHLS